MRQVYYDDFLRAWGHKLDAEQKEAAKGSYFFLCETGGFALKFKRKVCLVVLAVGNGLDFFREGIAFLRRLGITSLLFYFRENSPTSGLVRYTKGRRWVSRDTYSNGEPAHLAMVRLNSRRLKSWETQAIPA